MDEQGEVEFAVLVEVHGSVVVWLVFEAAFATEMGIRLEDAEVHGAVPSKWRLVVGLEKFENAALGEINEGQVIGRLSREGSGDKVGGLGVFEFAVKGRECVELHGGSSERGELEAGLSDHEKAVAEQVALVRGE